MTFVTETVKALSDLISCCVSRGRPFRTIRSRCAECLLCNGGFMVQLKLWDSTRFDRIVCSTTSNTARSIDGLQTFIENFKYGCPFCPRFRRQIPGSQEGWRLTLDLISRARTIDRVWALRSSRLSQFLDYPGRLFKGRSRITRNVLSSG